MDTTQWPQGETRRKENSGARARPLCTPRHALLLLSLAVTAGPQKATFLAIQSHCPRVEKQTRWSVQVQLTLPGSELPALYFVRLGFCVYFPCFRKGLHRSISEGGLGLSSCAYLHWVGLPGGGQGTVLCREFSGLLS